MALVKTHVDDGVAVVTLNRPEAMNALSRALRMELAAVLRRMDADPDVRAIVLTGAGDRAFTAGLDLKELGSDPAAMADTAGSSPDMDPVQAIEQCAKPVIGAINGVAITGGFELALACDILIASENARFADTHARVGLLPGWGLSQRLSRTIGLYRAKLLSLTGNFLNAETAAEWGLVCQVVPAQELLPAARRIAADIASVTPDLVIAYKTLIDDGYRLPLGEAMALERERSGLVNRQVSSADVERRRQDVQARGRQQ